MFPIDPFACDSASSDLPFGNPTTFDVILVGTTLGSRASGWVVATSRGGFGHGASRGACLKPELYGIPFALEELSKERIRACRLWVLDPEIKAHLDSLRQRRLYRDCPRDMAGLERARADMRASGLSAEEAQRLEGLVWDRLWCRVCVLPQSNPIGAGLFTAAETIAWAQLGFGA